LRLNPRKICDKVLQPFGYLVWASCGKDPGLNPLFLMEQARRAGRYTRAELSSLEFAGTRPDASELAEHCRMTKPVDGRIFHL